jgi:hypothetical protein
MACQPNFELRFSDDLHLHDSEKQKCLDLMTDFVGEYFSDSKEQCEYISVFPVSRLGFSGAKVFYVNIKRKGLDALETKVAKFDLSEDIVKEAEKAKILEQIVHGPYQKEEKHLNPLGMLIYQAIPDSKEFLQIMMSEEDILYCTNVIKNLYQDLVTSKYLKIRKSIPAKNIIEDYKRYLERKNNPLQKAQIIADYFNDQGEKLFAFYNQLLENPKYINPKIIHGDLHARNILANRYGSYLIDFDWVDEGHVAKDFTLLECTILYMILPSLILRKCKEHIALNELEALNRQLYNSFQLGTYQRITETDKKDHCYAKAFEVIKILRKYAEDIIQDSNNKESFSSPFEEYKYSLVLISLSQISFQDANLEILVHTANSIIDSLDEIV